MNKRYIDFVPAQNTTRKQVSSGKVATQKSAKKVATRTSTQSAAMKKTSSAATSRATTKATPRTTSKTVSRKTGNSVDELKKIKGQKITGSKKVGTVSKSATVKKTAKSTNDKKSVFVPPKPTFINQNKVVKRPLSGNIYRKEITQSVIEEPKGPVTIISKPEKDRHVGVVVTIILTIILGAAAGTMAFLLLPK